MKRWLLAGLLVVVALLLWLVLGNADRAVDETADGAGDAAPAEIVPEEAEERVRRRTTAEPARGEGELGPDGAGELGPDGKRVATHAAVRGRVLRAPDQPASGAVVQLVRGGKVVAKTKVPAGGEFAFPKIEQGPDISLLALAPGHGPGGMEGLVVEGGRDLDVGTVYLGAAIGSGVDNSLVVTVVDENGAPIPEARVTASTVFYGALVTLGHLEKVPGGTVLRATTGATGKVRFDELPPASYDVMAQADGFTFGLRQRFTIQRDTDAKLELELGTGLSISGTLVDTEGNPIAGGRVGALRWGDFTNFPPATSDAQGRFELGGLATGNYWVFAVKEDYGGADQQNVAAGTDDLKIEIPRGGEVTLHVTDAATGEPVTAFGVRPFQNVPFAYLFAPLIEVTSEDGKFTVVMPSASYGMEVSAKGYALKSLATVKIPSEAPVEVALEPAGVVHGRVVSKSSGAPVPGAEVFVKKGGFPPTRFKDLRVSTDADGFFTLDKLAPRTLSLWVSHVDHTEVAFEGIEPQVLGDDGALPPPQDFAVGSGGRITGRVFGDDSLPQSGANMQLSSGFDVAATRNTSVREDGTYEFRNVPPGANYTVSVGAFLPGQPGRSKSDVSVTEGGVVEVDFGTETGGVDLRGRVLSDEAPAGNVSVSLVSDDGGGSMEQTRTDADGVFVFKQVQPGRYQVTANAGRTRSVTAVVKDTPPEELTIVLVSTLVRGTIVDDQTGEPINGVYIECERIVEAGSTNLGSLSKSWKGNDATGSDGVFEIEGLEDGVYRFRAFTSGYGMELVDGVRIAEGKSITDLEIRLGPAGTLTGFVRSAQGVPVEGAQITIENEEGVPLFLVGLTTSNSDGGYTQGSLRPGRYTVSFQKDGYAPATQRVEIPADGAAEVDFVLLRGGRIEILVRDGGGKPVKDAIVTLYDAAGKPFRPPVSLMTLFSTSVNSTDANGQCTLRGIPPGTYQVGVARGKTTSRSGSSEVLEGATTSVELSLTPAE